MVSAWSFGTAQRGNLNSNAHVPGPGKYTGDKKQKYQPPSWKIGSGERTKFEANKTPGPGAYQVRPQTASAGEKYSMASKYKFKTDAFVPGPGAYNPRPTSAYKAAPQYSMGSKYDEVDKQGFKKNVGPGSYQQKSTFNKIGPKMGSAKRDQLYSTNQVPGPGQYGQQRPSTGAKYKMGTSQRAELYKNSTEGIGPGQYEIKSSFDNNKGITISSKRQQGDQIEASKVPGPGSYNPSKQPQKSAPSFKIGTSTRGNLTGNASKNPGPGTYSSNQNSKMYGTQVKFGTDVRKPLYGKNQTPGPGNYEYQSKVVEGPKFSVKGATQVDPITREKIMTPGPGQYQPQSSFTQHRPTSAKIGTSTRPDFLKSRDTPGPGNYTTGTRKEAGPSYGFGTSKRSQMAKKDEPGPGNYNIPTTFADVPKYAQNHSMRKN